MAVNRDWLRTQLVKTEGLVLHVHRDPKGLWSLGIGFCVQHIPEIVAMAEVAEEQDRLADLAINETQAYGILEKKIGEAVHAVDVIFGRLLPRIDTVRHTALVEMAYMLGLSELAGFPLMRAAIDRGDWEDAAAECLDSEEGRQHEEWGSDRWRGIAERLREGEGAEP